MSSNLRLSDNVNTNLVVTPRPEERLAAMWAAADRDAALEWIECNQLGRRNLSPEARKLLIGNVYNRRKKAAGGRADRNLSGPQNEAPKTSEQVASEFGTSRATVERAGAAAAAVAGTPLAGAVTGGKARPQPRCGTPSKGCART